MEASAESGESRPGKAPGIFHVLSEAFGLACGALGFEATKAVAGFKRPLQLLAA